MPGHAASTRPSLGRAAGGGRCRRVGHAIVRAGDGAAEIERRLAACDWDMVELDVLALDGELLVAHDSAELAHPSPVRFAEALDMLCALLPATVELDVDLKGTGYELAVLEVLHGRGLVERTLVSSMHDSSLRALRLAEPALRLGLSVPRARRNWLAHPLTRPGALVMLAYLRRALPPRVAAVLHEGLADAVMAHWGVVTPALLEAVLGAGAELYVWTVDDAARARELEALGVSGVIANDGAVFTGSPAAASPARR